MPELSLTLAVAITTNPTDVFTETSSSLGFKQRSHFLSSDGSCQYNSASEFTEKESEHENKSDFDNI